MEIGSRFSPPYSIVVDDLSKVGEVRRLANILADREEFDETARGNLAIVATEAASNVLKHAPGGELIFRLYGLDDQGGIELLSLDRGPGMTNLRQCMMDGYSTSGTLGGGLNAKSRLATKFELYSMRGSGTGLMCRVSKRNTRLRSTEVVPKNPDVQVGAVSLPISGETFCGDDWAVKTGSDFVTRILVVDGLGHGPLAAQASREATRIFHEKLNSLGLEALISCTREVLRSTRGAALATCEIDHRLKEIRFAGIGNISATVVNSEEQRSSSLMSYNGTVGHVIRKVQEFRYPWSPHSFLILHSDGIASRRDLTRYPGLSTKDPALIAGVLFRDFRRGRDDATVVVLRESGNGEDSS